MGFTQLVQQMNQLQGIAQNPGMYISEQMAKQMIYENPQQWQAAQNMMSGKNRDQQMQALRDLYRQKGMDLDSVARQYGIQL